MITSKPIPYTTIRTSVIQCARVNARPAVTVLHQQGIGMARCFSSTPAPHMRDFFPEKETPNVKITKPAWPHPVYANMLPHACHFGTDTNTAIPTTK